jgi:hypothetical protein
MKMILKMLVMMFLWGVMSCGCAAESDGSVGGQSDDEVRDPSYRPRGDQMGFKGASAPAQNVEGAALVDLSSSSDESESEEEEDEVEVVVVPKKSSKKGSGRGDPPGRGLRQVRGVRRVVVAQGAKGGTKEEGGSGDGASDSEEEEEVDWASFEDKEEDTGSDSGSEGSGSEEESDEEDGPTDGVALAAGMPVPVVLVVPAEPSFEVADVSSDRDGRGRWFSMVIPSFLKFHRASSRTLKEDWASMISRMANGHVTADGMFAKFFLRGLHGSGSAFTPLAFRDAVDSLLDHRLESAEAKLERMVGTRRATFMKFNMGNGLTVEAARELWEGTASVELRRRF